MARELFGPELWKKRVLELNASNERGIDVIRQSTHAAQRWPARRLLLTLFCSRPVVVSVGNKVKEFAQVAVGTHDNVPGYPCPPFKIIILDEADSMTKDAQSALRRTMEQYTKVTRFAIICNYVSRIIEPITSRCAKFRFQSLNSSSMTGRLRSIALAEQIHIEDDTLSKLVELSDGDMRRSITLLQSAQKLRGAKNQLRPEDVMEVAGVIPPERIAGLLASTKGSSFRTLQSAAQEMIYSAYPVDAILAHLLPAILSDETIGDAAKAKIAVRLAEAEHKLVQGADELLQLIDVCSFIAQSIAANV